MRRSNRTSFFPELSLRRLLLEGRRAARGGPSRCDVEKGVNSSSKGDKTSLGASSHNSKVSSFGLSLIMSSCLTFW